MVCGERSRVAVSGCHAWLCGPRGSPGLSFTEGLTPVTVTVTATKTADDRSAWPLCNGDFVLG